MKKPDIEITPATPELMREFHGQDIDRTVYGICALKDNHVIGVAGYFIAYGKILVFARLGDELKKNRRAVIRGYRQILNMVKGKGLPVFAMCDFSIEGAESLLLHMGFEHSYKEFYQWHG